MQGYLQGLFLEQTASLKTLKPRKFHNFLKHEHLQRQEFEKEFVGNISNIHLTQNFENENKVISVHRGF